MSKIEKIKKAWNIVSIITLNFLRIPWWYQDMIDIENPGKEIVGDVKINWYHMTYWEEKRAEIFSILLPSIVALLMFLAVIYIISKILAL